MSDLDFAIGGALWPGTSKVIEECGEVCQVLGKLIGTGVATAHWDGTDLRERITEEVADLLAALNFFATWNDLDWQAINTRLNFKRSLFVEWHLAQTSGEDQK